MQARQRKRDRYCVFICVFIENLSPSFLAVRFSCVVVVFVHLVISFAAVAAICWTDDDEASRGVFFSLSRNGHYTNCFFLDTYRRVGVSNTLAHE